MVIDKLDEMYFDVKIDSVSEVGVEVLVTAVIDV